MTGPRFPKQAIRGSFADVLDYARSVTGAHPAHLFAAWWVCVAASIGSSRYGYWSGRVVPTVYALCLGHTGDFKSSAMDLMLELLPDGVKCVTGATSDAGLFDSLDDEEKRPVVLHFDELGSLLGMASIKGSTLDALLNRLWGAPKFLDRNLSRKTPGAGERRIERPFACLLGGTHPGSFWKQIRDRDLAISSGVINRLAIFYVENTVGLDLTEEPDPDLAEKISKHLSKLNTHTGAHQVHLAADSIPYWKTIAARVTRQVREFDYPLDAVAARVRDHIARLALVYAVDRGDVEVSVDDLDAANAIGSYILASYRVLLESNLPDHGPSRATAIEDRVRGILARKAGEWLTAGEIQHLFPDSGSRPPAHELRRLLESMDGVDVEDVPRRGRKPRYRYTANLGPNTQAQVIDIER